MTGAEKDKGYQVISFARKSFRDRYRISVCIYWDFFTSFNIIFVTTLVKVTTNKNENLTQFCAIIQKNLGICKLRVKI